MTEQEQFADRYRRLPDSELVRLSSESETLVPEAKAALAEELAVRGCDAETSVEALKQSEKQEATAKRSAFDRTIRYSIGFLLAAGLTGATGIHLGAIPTVLLYALLGFLVDFMFKPRARAAELR